MSGLISKDFVEISHLFLVLVLKLSTFSDARQHVFCHRLKLLKSDDKFIKCEFPSGRKSPSATKNHTDMKKSNININKQHKQDKKQQKYTNEFRF